MRKLMKPLVKGMAAPADEALEHIGWLGKRFQDHSLPTLLRQYFLNSQ